MKKWIRKAASVALCAVLLGGSAAALPAVTEDIGITARADHFEEFNGFAYSEYGTNEVFIAYCSLDTSSVTIPTYIKGKKVNLLATFGEALEV